MSSRNGLDVALKLDGLAELRKALRGVAAEDRKQVNREIADRLVIPEAKREAPHRSGRLRESIKADATATMALILAGARGAVEYAGVIHFGWSTRGLGRGRSLADLRAAAAGAGVTSALGDSAIRKAARLGKVRERKIIERTESGRYVKGGRVLGTSRTLAVRGGPIRPNPWIYEAIDARSDEVFGAYEQQLEERFRIEGLL